MGEEQIKTEEQELADEIHELVSSFEMDTGQVVEAIELTRDEDDMPFVQIVTRL